MSPHSGPTVMAGGDELQQLARRFDLPKATIRRMAQQGERQDARSKRLWFFLDRPVVFAAGLIDQME